MKYDITFSCGHTETVQIYGSAAERARKVVYYEQHGICKDCYKAQKESEASHGCDEIRMSYRDYKNEHSSCKTKSGSYDSKSKTIVVYVPKSKKTSTKILPSKSEIFKAAHNIARALKDAYPDTDYRTNFSLTLKEIYVNIKTAQMAA